MADLTGFRFKVQIFVDSYAGTSHEFTIVDDGLRLEYQNDNKSVHDEIMSSAVTLTWVAATSDDENFLDDLRNVGDGNARIRIQREYTAGSGTYFDFWHGVMLDEITLLDDQPRIVELQFTDDIGLLDEVLYKETPTTEYTDQQPLPVILTRCLSKLRWWPHVYGANDTALKIEEYTTHDDISGTPAADNIIANHVRFRNPDNNGVFQYYTALEILVLCLRIMGSRISLFDGVWWVRPSAHFDNNGAVIDNYKRDGSLDTTPTLANNVEYNQTTAYKTLNVTIVTPTNQLAGVQFGTLPPLSEVTLVHDYDGQKFDWWGVSNNVSSGFYDVIGYGQDTTTQLGEVVTITFGYQFDIDGDNTTLEGARAKLRFRLRHGSTYAKRTADVITSGGSVVSSNYNVAGGYNVECFDVQNGAAQYSASTGNYIEVWSPVYYRANGVPYANGVEVITFPPLSGSTGTTQIEQASVVLYDADGVTTYTETAVVGLSFIYQMHGAAIAEGETIRYRRTNPDSSAREIEDLDKIILGDRVSDLGSPQTLNWAINIAGSGYTASTPDWNNAQLSTASQPIGSLVCWDRLAMRLDPCDTLTGTFRGLYIAPFRNLVVDTRIFIPTAMVYNMVSGFWDVEGIEYKYDVSTTPGDAVSPSAGFGLSGASAGQSNVVSISQFTGLVQKVANIESDQHDLRFTQADTNDDVANKFAAIYLDELADVNVPAPITTGHFLKYDGTEWRAAAVSGGGAFDDLTDVDVGSATDGQIVAYNDGNSEWEARTLAGIFRGIMFDGSGGGEMMGTGSLSFEVDDVVCLLTGYTGTDGIFACNTACTINQSTTLSVAISNWLAQASKFTQIGAEPDLSLSGLGASNSTDNFADSMQSFSITTSGASSFNAAAIVFVGPITHSGNLTTTGTFTASGLQYPTADGTNGQTLTTNGSGTLSWSTPSGGGGSSYSYFVLTSSFYAADGNGDYIPIGGTLSETTSSNYYTIWSAPLDGEIVKATAMVQATTAGSTTLRIRKYPVPTWIDSDTLTFSSAYTTETFEFTTATFNAGDRLQFWFDPTGRPNGVQISVLVKFTNP